MKLTVLFLLMTQFSWGSPLFVESAKNFTPDCNYLGSLPSHIQLDNLWYMARDMEVEKMNVPERNIIKIKIYWGLGECHEINYSRFTSQTLKFYPKDAWPLEPAALVKDAPPSVLKAGTHSEIVSDVLQSVTTLIMDRDVLAKELAEKKLSLKVNYLLSGLHAGFYYKKYKFIKLKYDFALESDGSITITAKSL